MQDNGIIQRIAEDVMGKKGAPKYPYVLCQRNVPPDLTYDLHAVGEWEGLKAVTVNGRVGYEIDPNFTLIIKQDGTCFIPDTPNNQAKLERLSKTQTTDEVRHRTNVLTGQVEEYTVQTIVPAPYQRVESNILNSALVKDLARQIRAELAKESNEFEEGGEAEIRPHHAANGEVSREMPVAKTGKKGAAMTQPGDPPKRTKAKPDGLLDPIR